MRFGYNLLIWIYIYIDGRMDGCVVDFGLRDGWMNR